MNCLECRGACCEDILIPVERRLIDDDALDWLETRGRPVYRNGTLAAYAFEARCPLLTTKGLCHIYEARPAICRRYEPGGPDCLETLKRRRTPEQRARIAGGFGG